MPGVFVAQELRHTAHTLRFVLCVLAIVPLAALLGHATESIATRTGDGASFLLGGLRHHVQEYNRVSARLRSGWLLLATIALFVAPVLVLLSYVLGPVPMDLQFWPGAAVMTLIATFTASQMTTAGNRPGSWACSSGWSTSSSP